MKKTISLLAALSMLAGVWTAPVYAEPEENSDKVGQIELMVEFSGKCGDNASWRLDNDGVLTISGTGDMTDWYSSYDVEWYAVTGRIKKVVIEDGITSIGNNAFFLCDKMTEVTISEEVTRIGDNAFHTCMGLKEITIPNKVEGIGEYAFYYCTGLTDITIPDSVIEIGKDAFEYCTALTSAKLPEMLDDIPDYLFYHCSKLESVNIPYDVQNIGSYAFAECGALSGADMSDNIISIGDSAFMNCASLTDITMPDSVETVGTEVFSGCSGLSGAHISENITNISYQMFKDTNLESIVIPAKAEIVYDEAFSGCTGLKDIIIEEGVREIYSNAFSGCTGIERVSLPGSLGSVSDYMFDGCVNLTAVELGEGIENIYSYAFRNCKKLENIILPESVAYIGEGAFQNCSALSGINIPKNLTAVNALTFSGCGSLSDVILYNGVTSIGSEAFKECASLDKIVIPSSVESVAAEAFRRCTALSEAEFEYGIKSIGARAFRDCSSLSKVYIPNSIEQIDNYAFSNCSSDLVITGYKNTAAQDYAQKNNITFNSLGQSGVCGDGLTWILSNDGALTINGDGYMDWGNETEAPWYSSRDEITSVVIGENVHSISEGAFQNCSALEIAEFFGSDTEIGENAFEGCSDSLVIKGFTGSTAQRHAEENNITFESTGVFEKASGECGNKLTWTLDSAGLLTVSGEGEMTSYPWYYGNGDDIKKVVIDSGVTSICSRAFSNCHGLESAVIPDSVKSIGEYAFDDCTALRSVTLPSGLESVENYVFMNCHALESAIIPDSVKSIGEYAFHGCTALRSVTLPLGLESVEDCAFMNCYNLESVIIPDSVKSIGDQAFYGCQSLKEIKIPDSVTSITRYAFSDSGLESVIIPPGVTEIATGLFYECGSLKSVTLPDGIKSIEDEAFRECQSLEDISIPEGVQSIGYTAFRECQSLKSITIPASVTSIYSDAFYGHCDEFVIKGYRGTEAEEYARNYGIPFEPILIEVAGGECGEGLTWTLDSEGTLTVSGEGQMTDWSSRTETPWYIALDSIRRVIIDSGVAGISNYAFESCYKLEDVYYNGSSSQWARLPVGGGNEPLLKAKKHYMIDDDVFSSSGYVSDSFEITLGKEQHCWEFTPSESGEYIFKPAYSDNGLQGCVYDSEFNELYSDNADGGRQDGFSITFNAQADKTYYLGAKWRDGLKTESIHIELIRQYLIRYDANGGTEAPEDQNKLYNEDITLSVFSPVREKFFFNGWALSRDAAEAKYNAGSNFNENADTTLYAVWESAILEKPSISESNINGGKSVTVTAPAANADIYYTLDGSEPTAASEKYTAPIELKTAGAYTVKAIAVKNGYTGSETVLWETEVKKLASPSATVGSGNVKNGTKLELNAQNGAEIYYSVNGSEDRAYSGEITINDDAVIAAYAVMAGSVNSDTVQFKYTVDRPDSGTDGAVTWNIVNGNLIISGGDEISDHEAGGAPWYPQRDEITKITVNANLKTIGKNAFYNLSGAQSISLPQTVTQIGDGGFEGCAALKEITLTNTLTTIGAGAFKGCSGLTSLTVPDSVKTIGAGAFEGCAALRSISLPFIGSQAGGANTKDTFEYAFNSNVPSSLSAVNITNETIVPQNAFKGLSHIETVTLNDAVSSMGGGAFDGCAALKEFTVPSRVQVIGSNTFRGCESAASIEIPDTVTAMGESVFDGCKRLLEVNIPSELRYIAAHTFRNCSALTKIDIPLSVINIGEGVLEGCAALIDLRAPFIGANGSPETTSASDKYILGYLFGVTDNADIPPALTRIEVTGTDAEGHIAKEAFKNCPYIVDVIIDGGAIVDDHAFMNCKNLKNLYIPKTVHEIGDTILEGCGSIETLTVPFIGADQRDKNTETSVLGGFFGICPENDRTGIKQYYNESQDYHYYKIPKTLKNVSLLTQIEIPTGAFSECRSIKHISIVRGAVMNDYAFFNCSALESAALPEDLQVIGAQAFAGCSSLERVNLPSRVKTIGSLVFFNCRNLKNVIMPDSVADIAEDVFEGTNMISLYGAGEFNLTADNGMITCSEGGAAYNYALAHNIKTNIVPSKELSVRKTSTTITLLSDGSYLFDVINAYSMHGTLNIQLYDAGDKKLTEKSINENDIEYRVEFGAEEMANVSYANISIQSADGNGSTESEILSEDNGDFPYESESDIEITYRNGEVILSGTASIKAGTVLAEVIYGSDNRPQAIHTHPVTSIDDIIKVSVPSAEQTARYMLWSGLNKMRPLAKAAGN